MLLLATMTKENQQKLRQYIDHPSLQLLSFSKCHRKRALHSFEGGDQHSQMSDIIINSNVPLGVPDENPGGQEERENGADYEYVFGFGSIMNTTTHATWQSSAGGEPKTTAEPIIRLQGRIVRIKQSFGYARFWNFQSSTGFTALGVSRVASPTKSNDNNDTDTTTNTTADMNGVLFRVPSSMMPGFDRREIGYDKVAIPLEFIQICDDEYNNKIPSSKDNNNNYNNDNSSGPDFELKPTDKIWMYVPQESHCREADENHPLLQSYVDTVLQGCLEWGGEKMAEDFILSTGKWSNYFLNDTPNSRRPWLFRKEYDTIDRVLRKHSDRTRYADRRHPEEFASAFLLRRMRGTWSLPRRNFMFTGRDFELGQIHAQLTQQQQQQSSGAASLSECSVAYLEVTGLGGVGKSSICTEYCYRHFPSSYGLVVWLNAESAEALVADYKQLLADLADGDINASNKDTASNNSTDEVIGEVKTRLYRSNVPWLLVFDNLEDRKLLRKFVPRGASSGSKGHVLVTTRLFDMELGRGPSTLVLGCLSPNESVEMLRRALGPEHINDSPKTEAAAREICERLGHLPLALGMAAAYMQRCDVACVEYVERYVRSEQNGRSLLRHQAGRLHDYNLTVSASLSLSLKAIEKESRMASDILRLLCWLGPDQITKAIIRTLLNVKFKADEERSFRREKQQQQQQQLTKHDPSVLSPFPLSAYTNKSGLLFLCGVTIGSSIFLPMGPQRSISRLWIGAGVLAACSLYVRAVSPKQPTLVPPAHATTPPSLPARSQSNGVIIPVDEFEQSDLIWNILKCFSILIVKEGKGSMHRLLAHSLRASQSSEESCHNLLICVRSMERTWAFKAKDTETWQSSLHVVEHVKSLVSHAFEQDVCPDITLKAGILSKEAGVFSAMALNGFIEAQASLDLALKLFDKCMAQKQDKSNNAILQARAEALHELGRVFRYQGNFVESEEALLNALSIRKELACGDVSPRSAIADTLHELGVLEVKKHNLDSSQKYLTEALDLRRTLDGSSDEINADCAATLHQLATVHVARKPPLLEEAEKLLQEALRLSRQIGQRAATLKQLARVTIRQGLLDTAEGYLRKALELYIELYGERAMHINVAAVKFQQGALALQRDQYEQAWIHFSECLRIRRHVYAYARPIQTGDGKTSGDPLHLEVSCVLHELGCVAFAQRRFSEALNMLHAERSILEKLEGSSMHIDKILQSRLTNLTWLRKCAKEKGDEAAVTKFINDRLELKGKQKERTWDFFRRKNPVASALQEEALQCRLSVRQLVLAKCKGTTMSRDDVLRRLARLKEEIDRSPPSSMKESVEQFYKCVSRGLQTDRQCEEAQSVLLQACDMLRDALREHGLQVNDRVVI